MLFSLGPYETSTFLIIVKAPVQFPRKKGNLISHLLLNLIPEEEDMKAERTEKRINEDGTIDTKQVSINRQMKVILCGKLENPTLSCLKGLNEFTEQGIDA